MKYVILVSHGTFAQGLHNTLGMLAGSGRDDILSLGLLDGMSVDTFGGNFAKLIQNINKDDHIFLLADIIGGSPLTTSLNILSDCGLLQNTTAFGGMNLSMALNAVLEDDTDLNAFKKLILSEAHESAAEFVIQLSDEGEEDDI